jgi:hypothetical protein
MAALTRRRTPQRQHDHQQQPYAASAVDVDSGDFAAAKK